MDFPSLIFPIKKARLPAGYQPCFFGGSGGSNCGGSK
jgi:hypothetical protein